MHFRRSTAVIAAFFLAVVGYLPSVATAQAAARTATLVGSRCSRSLVADCGDWAPSSAPRRDLTPVAGTSSTYEKVVRRCRPAPGSWKVAINHSWDESLRRGRAAPIIPLHLRGPGHSSRSAYDDDHATRSA
jgi:hypothetical protein